MAKTLKMLITFPMTVVVKTETIEALEGSRADVRAMDPEKVANLKGEQKFRYELFAGDKTTEEVLEVIYRQGLRSGVRELIMEELQGNESTCRVGDIKVAYEKGPKPSCQGCTQTTCIHQNREKNLGCDLKMVGIRPALERACSCNACFECRLARGWSE